MADRQEDFHAPGDAHGSAAQVAVIGIKRDTLGADGVAVMSRVELCRPDIPESADIYRFTPQALYEAVRQDAFYFRATGGGITFAGFDPECHSGFIEEFRRLCGPSWRIEIQTDAEISDELAVRLQSVVNQWLPLLPDSAAAEVSASSAPEAEDLPDDVAVSEAAEAQDEYCAGHPRAESSIFKECAIAGLSYHLDPDDELWDHLRPGLPLALVRQPGNEYDRNAVAVALADDFPGDPERFDFDLILGYIPRGANEELAAMMDAGYADRFTAELTTCNQSGYYNDRLRLTIRLKNQMV